jgi:hypothetical protein
MSTVRSKFNSQLVLMGTSKVTIATATTTSFDFGTPDDINLATTTASAPGLGYRPGDRLFLVFQATTTGTTDTVSFVVQDAADSSGSIGSPAAAVTDGTLTGGTGTQYARTSVVVQPGRPWIRCTATGVGATDTHVVQCTVYAIPRSGL